MGRGTGPALRLGRIRSANNLMVDRHSTHRHIDFECASPRALSVQPVLT